MSDGYPTRTPGQTVWLAAAAGLLVVLLAGGGWLVWRGFTSPPPATVGAPPGTLTGGSQVAFGAPQLVDGVPWGFALTPDGATAAGLVAVTVTGQAQVVFDPDRFAAVVAVVFTPAQADAQARLVDAARTEFEMSGWASQPSERRTYHFAPLAVRLASYDPAALAAQVEVWAMTLVGVGDTGGAVFTTTTVQLAADGSTWTVIGLDTVEGPTPMVAGTPSAPGRVRALVRDATATLPLPVTVP